LSCLAAGNMVREKDLTAGWNMDYAKYTRCVSGINTAKLALWAALLFVVVVAGVAALGSGRY
jgi:hypothetical protein